MVIQVFQINITQYTDDINVWLIILYLQIGNPYIDDNTALLALFDNLWTHAFNSDETNAGIHKYCNLTNLGDNPSEECAKYVSQASMELGEYIDIANIYAPVCPTSEDDSEPKSASTGSASL